MNAAQIRSGRRIAYVVMIAMLGLSIAGNLAHTYLINPDPSGRALVYAVVWPLAAWAGVELFIRIPWRSLLSHHLVRWGGILLVASIAALVSYRHLRGLLIADGEEWVVYTIGPLAIDGLMLMATLALLLTRPQPAPEVLPDPFAADLAHMADLTERVAAEVQSIEQATEVLPAPVSPAGPRAPRTRAAGSWDIAKAVQLILDGDRRDQEIGDTVGVGAKMVQRTRRAVTLLREDPRAEVPNEWKVPAAVVQVIRAEVSR